MSSDESARLRAEIQRLLAFALAVDVRHIDESVRLDLLHVQELERRDELHLGESATRDEVHLEEMRARGALHAHEVQNLRTALASRDVMGQAKGVMMASMGCSAEDAFQLIVKQSQHENRKAVDVAAEIIDRAAKRPHRPSA